MKIKPFIQRVLISIFQFSTYLYLISRFRILTFGLNRKETDFKHFVSLIPREGHILDIGANIGVLTHFLARKRKDATIHSFEPSPFNFKNLKKVVGNFKLTNTRIYNTGLGHSAFQIDMIIPVINGVKKHARCQVYDQDSIYTDGEKFKIDIDKLDDMPFFHDPKNKVTAIKIDVENYEYQVFIGAVNLIKRHRPIIFCELFPSPRKLQLIKLFEDLDYNIKVFNYDRLIDYDPNTHSNSNCFFIPAENCSLAKSNKKRERAAPVLASRKVI
jgi:FkbM family methyltransferase